MLDADDRAVRVTGRIDRARIPDADGRTHLADETEIEPTGGPECPLTS